ncbi:hypothetical protein T08_2491 [Trichinella sp. T8]|nr:hypothetical protein T08_2491 [Trichinella sp. T8]
MCIIEADSQRAISICSGNVDVEFWNLVSCSRSQNAILKVMQCAIACIVEPVVSLLISRIIRLELSNISILRHPSHHRPMLSSLYYIITIADATVGWINTVRNLYFTETILAYYDICIICDELLLTNSDLVVEQKKL